MIALIDGDVLCHLACESRWEAKARTTGNPYIQLDEEGKRKVLEFDSEEIDQYMEASWKRLQDGLEFILEKTFASDYLMAVKGPNNFRDRVYDKYKINRKKNSDQSNIFIPKIRQLTIDEGIAVEAVNYEADDLLRIWAEQSRGNGQPYVVCSIDKDLKCIPGKHYNIKYKEIEDITEADALRFFYTQLLQGDPADSIPGVRGIGPVKAKALLALHNNEEDFQEVVVEQYMNNYGEYWREELLLNGKLLHILRHENDHFNFENWPIVKELQDVELKEEPATKENT